MTVGTVENLNAALKNVKDDQHRQWLVRCCGVMIGTTTTTTSWSWCSLSCVCVALVCCGWRSKVKKQNEWFRIWNNLNFVAPSQHTTHDNDNEHTPWPWHGTSYYYCYYRANHWIFDRANCLHIWKWSFFSAAFRAHPVPTAWSPSDRHLTFFSEALDLRQ